MGRRDPQVDRYIANAEAFARPILNHIRERVHAACPEAVETMKWSFPHFEYKGILCSMAAFKAHCTFGFWKGALVVGRAASDGAMGQFGRITRIADLPPNGVLRQYIRAAVRLNEAGVRVPRAPRVAKASPEVPEDLMAALIRSAGALAAFRALSPSHCRRYVEWITEARRDATRARRIERTVDRLAEGKPRHAKYTADSR